MMNSCRATTLLLLCAFASLIACSTAFVAIRPRSVGRQPKTNAQLAVIDADLASDLLQGAVDVTATTVADHHLAISDTTRLAVPRMMWRPTTKRLVGSYFWHI